MKVLDFFGKWMKDDKGRGWWRTRMIKNEDDRGWGWWFAGSLCPSFWCHVIVNWLSLNTFERGLQHRTSSHTLRGSAPRIACFLLWVWYVLVWVWRKKTSHQFLCTCLTWSSYLQREREGDIAKVNLLRGKSSTSDKMNCHTFALQGWQSGILLQKLEFQPVVRNMD